PTDTTRRALRRQALVAIEPTAILVQVRSRSLVRVQLACRALFANRVSIAGNASTNRLGFFLIRARRTLGVRIAGIASGGLGLNGQERTAQRESHGENCPIGLHDRALSEDDLYRLLSAELALPVHRLPLIRSEPLLLRRREEKTQMPLFPACCVSRT